MKQQGQVEHAWEAGGASHSCFAQLKGVTCLCRGRGSDRDCHMLARLELTGPLRGLEVVVARGSKANGMPSLGQGQHCKLVLQKLHNGLLVLHASLQRWLPMSEAASSRSWGCHK